MRSCTAISAPAPRYRRGKSPLIPSLVDAVENNDAARIAALMKKIRASSDASYIVIGDNHARHLYHSEYEGRLGTPMIGGDNKEVLEGKSIISIRKGGIGVSLRSKAPIVDENNRVIGIVSVGYLKSHIDNLNARTLTQIIVSIVLLLIALFVFSLAAVEKSQAPDVLAGAERDRAIGAPAKSAAGSHL